MSDTLTLKDLYTIVKYLKKESGASQVTILYFELPHYGGELGVRFYWKYGDHNYQHTMTEVSIERHQVHTLEALAHRAKAVYEHHIKDEE